MTAGMMILKIGGSVLTDKSKKRTPRPQVIKRLAGEIASRDGGLVLVHGAGSCGHDSAARYGIASGLSPGSEQGLFATHREVAMLCDMLCVELQEAGVASLPLHPLDLAITTKGRITSFNTLPVTACLERGVLPVLHGDVCLDAGRGAAILSGDQLAVYLALELGAVEVGMGTDVDGVLDGDGNPIPEITPGKMAEMRDLLGGSAHVDVTGGMLGKVEELCKMAEQGIPASIFNANEAGNVKRFLENQSPGTRIHGDG